MISEETLKELYLNQQLTMNEISKRLDLGVGTVFNYVHKYGLERPKQTERSRERMSLSRKGKPTRPKGYHLSEETKRKISECQKGRLRKPSKYGGHTKQRSDGYVYVYVPDHPYATKDGYVMEHILVMEEAIGRYIMQDEVVHHINKKRNDNRLENLKLMSFKEHTSLHTKERYKKGEMRHHTVKVRNVTTGETFNSCKEGAEKYGVAPTNISKACKGLIKIKGCDWEYIKEE